MTESLTKPAPKPSAPPNTRKRIEGVSDPQLVEGKPDARSRAHEAGPGGRELFDLFSMLAGEAGREDLATEFRKRAAEAPAKPSPTDPSVEAEKFHTEACALVRAGKLVEAEKSFREAIRHTPAHANAHGNLGVALARLKRLPEAEAAFRVAIRLDPVGGTMYVNLATCLYQQGRFQDADEWARQAIQLKPDTAEAHRLLGCSLDARKQYAPAEAALREAARLDPGNAETQHRLGSVLVRRDLPKEAEAAFREAVKLNPKVPGGWPSLANLLANQDRHAEAADCLREAVALEPNSAELHNSLGVSLASCEKFLEAEAEYREALRLDPKMVSSLSNLGNTLRALGQLDEAEASLREALRLKPSYAEAHNNLGIVHVQKGRDEEGLRCYEEALRLAPKYPEAHLNRGLALLGNGDFANGWAEYEWRWKLKPSRHSIPPGPRWDGSPMHGRPLLITSEQGLGDSIHFVRYCMLAKERGATVIFDCPASQASLLATCPGIDRVVTRGKEPVTYDAHISLLSLPSLFGVPPEAETAPIPYLTADPERVEYWRKELAGVEGLKIGISWQGSKLHKGDRMRSVPVTRFAPLAEIPGVTLVSIQKGHGSEQLTDGSAAGMKVIDIGSRTDPEMSDTAAVLMNLDLLISVDTAVVHLAGALGRPVWVALPYASDWRWLRNGEDSPWYPSMRLFRQTTSGHWDWVFEQIGKSMIAHR